jgi:hypothetical protein
MVRFLVLRFQGNKTCYLLLHTLANMSLKFTTANGCWHRIIHTPAPISQICFILSFPPPPSTSGIPQSKSAAVPSLRTFSSMQLPAIVEMGPTILSRMSMILLMRDGGGCLITIGSSLRSGRLPKKFPGFCNFGFCFQGLSFLS